MELIDMTQWMTMISNFGFPLTLSLFVLLRLDKKMDELLKEWKKINQDQRKENAK
ncbi:YvrJ family protein [Niallia alba]|uniref:YvrJ family protein n=1 Tax=Niallia circulans TaxID=1397 RepID=A0A941GND6_NIACI|nr:YvrJ family protein [Niallia circulans]MCB5238272.1 YvrJ family protein [Niallia circulans]